MSSSSSAVIDAVINSVIDGGRAIGTMMKSADVGSRRGRGAIGKRRNKMGGGIGENGMAKGRRGGGSKKCAIGSSDVAEEEEEGEGQRQAGKGRAAAKGAAVHRGGGQKKVGEFVVVKRLAPFQRM